MKCHDCFEDSLSVELLADRAASVGFGRAAGFPSSIAVTLECPHGGLVNHMSHPGTSDFDWCSDGLRRQEGALLDSSAEPDSSLAGVRRSAS